MAMQAVQIKVFSSDGSFRVVNPQAGEPVPAASGERYLVSIDGQPLPEDAQVVRNGSNLEIRIDDETVVEFDQWCELSDSSLILLSPQAHAIAIGASQLPDNPDLTVGSGDCAIVAGATPLGSLAAVEAGGAMAGAGFPVWQALGAVGAVGLIAAASGGGGGSSEPLALTASGEGLDASASSGGIAPTNSPSISGKTAGLAKVIVELSTGQVLTTVADENGNWSVEATDLPADGAYRFTAVAEDQDGNRSEPVTGSFVLDTTAPAEPTVALAPESDTGAVGDSLSNNPTPTLSGGNAQPGDTINVTTPTGETLSAKVGNDGTWSVTPAVPLGDGEHEFKVTATDRAGNTSEASSLFVTIETTPPAAPSAALSSESDSGAAGDGLTNDATPVIAGTGASAGDTITVITPKGEVLSTTVAEDGSWSVTPGIALDDGTNRFSVIASDPAGNESDPTDLELTVNTSAPQTPSAGLTADADTGVRGDQLTNKTTPELGGDSAVPGDTITVTTPRGEVLTATVASDGTWSVTPTLALNEGSNTISVVATDPAGNVSEVAEMTVVVDSAASPAPTVALAPETDSGAVGDGLTSDARPALAGTGATPGDAITVTTPKGEVLTTIVDDDGAWSVSPSVPLDDGSNHFSVTATDSAGNVSAATTLVVDVDSGAPAAPAASVAATSDSGTPGDSVTNVVTPTISGSGAAAGDIITVTTPKGEVLTSTVAANGTWSVTPTVAFDEGSNVVEVVAIDPAGNESAATTLALVVDTTAPDAPAAAVAAVADSGASGDSTTSNTTPAISGTGATAGDTITVTTPKGEVLATTVAADGSWSVTPTIAFDEGSNEVEVIATDPTGNESAATTVTVVIDTTAPVAPSAGVAATSDSGTPGDNITNDTAPAISGTGATAGDTITVTTPKGEVLSTTVGADGSWSVTPTIAFDEGGNEVEITATDPSGNESAATTLTVVVDTSAPVAPAAGLAAASDSGTPGDNITNDTTPAISGAGATAGDTVTVTTPKGETLSTTVGADGSWSVTPTVAFDEGSNEIEITATDPAGNESAASTLTLIVDTTAPAAPAASLSAGSGSGGNITSEATPEISGTGASTGDTITVTMPTGEVLTTTVAADGS